MLITQLETGELSQETVMADGMVSPLREILTAAINLARNFSRPQNIMRITEPI